MKSRGLTIASTLLAVGIALAVTSARAEANEAIANRTPGESGLRRHADRWVGTWTTTYGNMTLRRSRDGQLVGVYGPAKHPIAGRLLPHDRRVFAGTWTHNGNKARGRFRFRMTEPGKFEGGWTNGDNDPENVVNWTGSRK